MARISVSISVRPPTRLQRAWYHRLRKAPPTAVGSTGGRMEDLARMVPYRWRSFHRAYAKGAGYFWLLCPLCNEPFGGHEAGGDVPDPTQPPLVLSICSRCTRARS